MRTYIKWDNNQCIKFILSLEITMGWKSEEDWYLLTQRILIENGGRNLVYTNKIYNIPKILYPDYDFLEWKFIKSNIWKSNDMIVKYLKWLGIKMNWNSEEDYYGLNSIILKNNYGSALLRGRRIIDIVKILYPNYDYKEWLFDKVSNFWNDDHKVLEYLNWLIIKNGWSCEEDLYKLSYDILLQNGGISLTSYYDLSEICNLVYPDYSFDTIRFSKYKKQKECYDILRSIISEEILYDDRKTIYNINTKRYLELDIYVPSLKFAIEYDGQQHFKDKKIWDGLEKIKYRDSIKDMICEDLGIRLFRISYKEKDLNSIIRKIVLALSL